MCDFDDGLQGPQPWAKGAHPCAHVPPKRGLRRLRGCVGRLTGPRILGQSETTKYSHVPPSEEGGGRGHLAPPEWVNGASPPIVNPANTGGTRLSTITCSVGRTCDLRDKGRSERPPNPNCLQSTLPIPSPAPLMHECGGEATAQSNHSQRGTKRHPLVNSPRGRPHRAI